METDEKANILLVDDRPENLMALEAVLASLGENCVKAQSGTEALRRLLHMEFAVILLDVHMPDIDGFETAALIRQRDKSADIPIIFVTAMDKSATHVFRGYAAGAVDYILKPFDPETLRSKVRVFVKLFRNSRQLRMQAERLRESEERYALAVEGAADGIWDWDIRANQIYYSPRWKGMLGFAPEEIGASPTEWFKRVLPEDFESLQAELNAHLDGKTDHFEIERRMIHRDGSVRWMLWRGLAVRDAAGLAHRMAGSLSDVTRRKLAEEELVKKERLAAIGMIVSNVAHSIKNILQGVRGGFFLIEKRVDEHGLEDLREPARILKSSIVRLDQLVMNMLDHSKERQSARTEVDCEAVFAEVRDTLIVPAERRHVRMEFQVDPSAKILLIDPDRLARALVNLGTNAIDAMDGGEGALYFSASARSISRLPLEGAKLPPGEGGLPDEALVVEVRDTGSGMPDDIAERIFEPFFSTKGSKGTGLGLASVKDFAKDQNGVVLVESKLGQGTTFRLVFFDALLPSQRAMTG